MAQEDRERFLRANIIKDKFIVHCPYQKSKLTQEMSIGGLQMKQFSDLKESIKKKVSNAKQTNKRTKFIKQFITI